MGALLIVDSDLPLAGSFFRASMSYGFLVTYPERAGAANFVISPGGRWQFGHRAAAECFVDVIRNENLYVEDCSAAGISDGCGRSGIALRLSVIARLCLSDRGQEN